MAQWNQRERTLVAKVVYYGPALGGKTTNLEALHRRVDPQGVNRLLSLNTSADRTLFFDLLPLELGDIHGYRLVLKLFTVPGQVRYDSTRRVVLAGADAVIFVADSARSREQQNQWSLQNLVMNLRANGIDPKSIPLLFQANKQDLDEAAPPREVARWLRVPDARVHAACAVTGDGVLETFIDAAQALVRRLSRLADAQTRSGLDVEAMERRIADTLTRRGPRPAEAADAAGRTAAVVLDRDEPAEQAVQATVLLGEQLSDATGERARLEREVESLRCLNESLREVGANFERERIVDATLRAASDVLDLPLAGFVERAGDGWSGRALGGGEEPLAADAGPLLERLGAQAAPCTVDDGLPAALAGYRELAAVPVVAGSSLLTVYNPRPERTIEAADVRFLATLAAHLAVGLEKAELYRELGGQRDRLEQTVRERTAELRRAYEELRDLERVKDGFLANMSHEMKTPLTAIISSASFLRDYEAAEEQRREMVDSIMGASSRLEELFEDLFRLAEGRLEEQPLEPSEIGVSQMADAVREFCDSPRLKVRASKRVKAFSGDTTQLARALNNLIDNALKFSPAKSEVELQIKPARLTGGQGARPAVAFCVLDHGEGVPVADRERIFAPFEQGGPALTGKPGGVGLGLFEARAIAERHGGRLEYRPRSGGGSEFRLRVPLAGVTTERRA